MSGRGAALAVAVAVAAALVPASAASGASRFGARPLAAGASGKDVRALQRNLTRLGYRTPVTGVYGPDTRRSVKRLERKRGWPVNGKVSRSDAAGIVALVAKRAKRRKPAAALFYQRGLSRPTVTLSAGAAGTATLEVVDTRSGGVVAELPTRFDSAGTGSRSWDGLASGGYAAPDSSYRIRMGEAGGTGAVISGGQSGAFKLRLHAFPLPGPHSYGGSGSRFGAGRGDHAHQGQDMAAGCGEPLLAAAGGTVVTRAYQAGGAGHYLVIHGAITGSDYVYMHMPKPSWAAEGTRVYAGQQVGKVGSTGASTGCHLHFERWTPPGWYAGGRPYDPLGELRYWDGYS